MRRALRLLLWSSACLATQGCSDHQATEQAERLAFVSQWFDQANQGVREEGLCHGLGLLKHPEFSCAQMLDHAAQVDPETRNLTGTSMHDCFGGVCGEFIEMNFDSVTHAGAPISETALLKRDDGRLRLYWYRSDTLLAILQSTNPDPEEDGREPLQVAYDELTALHPSLYRYPPCFGVRPSSANLVGAIQTVQAINAEQVEALADDCGETFCFALVGNKIATLCPTP